MSRKDDNCKIDQPDADQDLLIDSLLDECLGGVTPPDLTEQILSRLDAAKRPHRPALVSTRRTSHARLYKSTRAKYFVSPLAGSIALAMLLTAIGFVAWKNSDRQPLATRDERPISTPAQGADADVSPRVPPAESSSISTDDEPSDSTGTHEAPTLQETQPPAEMKLPDTQVAEVQEIDFFEPLTYDRPASPSPTAEIVDFVDAVFREQWANQQLQPAKPSSEEQWLEDVYRAILGRSPDAEEVAKFTRSAASTKRADVVRSLVASDTYSETFNRHWVAVLQERLLNDETATTAIRNALLDSRPYNQLVETLVADSSANAVSICRNVVGVRLECAKCHEDQGQSAADYARFAAALHPDHRDQFADVVANSEEAYQTLVNHVWQHFFGQRLTPWSNETRPVLQPVLERLTQEFVASNFDVKRLIEWVALTEPFALSNQLTQSNQSDSAIASEPLFARRYRYRELGSSVEETLQRVAAASIDFLQTEADPIDAIGSRAPNLELREPVKSTDEPEFWSTIELMNRDPDRARILVEYDQLLDDIASSELSDQEKVEHVFLAVRGRSPSTPELEAATKILRSQKTNEILGLRDIWWAISKSGN